MLKDRKKIFEIVAIVLIIIFAVSISPKTLQNDTYYTVTIGELILENGIDMEDHFSWNTTRIGETLPYTYPHWLYDVIMYLIYSLGIFIGGIEVRMDCNIYFNMCISINPWNMHI